MNPVAVVAIGAESALGSGEAAYAVGAPGDVPESAIAEDATLRAHGLAKPFVARAPGAVPVSADRDPAAELLGRAVRSLAGALDHRMPGWRSLRVGVVLGTSSGGMVPLTRALGALSHGETVSADLARATPYFGPLGALSELGVRPVEIVQVLAACASSGLALGLGCRWLELGHADLVVAGGYDVVSAFVAAGFESLGATSATRPAPFRTGRDGMALGEAAVLWALLPASASERPLGYVTGFGASSDAVHVTAPDRSGAGLARAAEAALADAGLASTEIGLVSAHATATPFNDAAEARALGRLLGERATEVVVHPFKAVVGHTLGASAVLEASAALAALRDGLLPAAIGRGALDPEATVRLLPRNERGTARHALKLSAAFGGANAAMVVSTVPASGRPLARSGVALAAVGEMRTARDIEAVAGLTIPDVQRSRMDPLSAAAVAAVASALARAPELPRARTGVVVGTAAATLENNEAFDRRFRERRAPGVEPRRFPPTSPNLPAGQCSIAFGLLGPSLSVGAGPTASVEALLVAFDLVESGDADAIVVVAAEHVGPTVQALFEAAGAAVPADGALSAVLVRGDRFPEATPVDRQRWRALALAPDPTRFRPGWPALAHALGAAGDR